ncbi:T9SS type A sorting domain-containing protein, partial [candidate division KSB1 bacterium]|nr:T9SS type A sorting domain-containing protein [candidate division KSB1 bacterium]
NPLIDESRDDGIDNDGDWDPTTDDVGLDGVALTGDPGEGDGLPTSGADSGSPGEPNIDKTDVDESDMIGLSAFQLFEPWTLYPLSDDEALWTGTVPGHIIDTQIVGDPEVLFGSGYFSLSPKQLQKISLGYMYGTDKTDLYANKAGAEKMVRTGYRHKIITPIPTLTAIAGNHRVTLQWDDAAEQYEDPIIGKAFEGYKVYRETNSSHLRYGEPIAQFDLVNEYQGPSSILINGQAFWLGENTGLEYSLVDTTVQNGQIYYYAVTSYTHGQPSSGIPPEECSTYFKGTNVATVMPIDPKVKDLYPDPDSVRHVKGISTGTIEYLIVDSEEMPENHTFRVTFQDSFNVKYCHQTTKCFYLTDITQPLTPDTIIANGDVFDLNGEIINYFICGLKLLFDGVRSSKANYDSSGWSREGIYKFSFERSLYPYIDGCVIPNDYRIEFGEAGMDTSTLCYITDTIILRDVPVNFKVFNKTTGREIRFAFWEQDGEDGLFSGYTAMSESDRIIFIEPVADKERFTWLFELESQLFDADNPKSGDFVDLYTLKPFSAGDIFEFTTPVSLDTSHEDENPSNGQIYFSLLQNYPNPFNPETFISFTVPKSCHVKLAVYNIKGQIVRLLVSRQLPAGTSEALWDGCDQTGNRVGSGIYFYRIQAGEYNRTRKMLLVR